MGMKLVVAACLLLTGCLWANEHSESLVGYSAQAMLDGDGQPTGAAAQAMAGYAGMTADLELNTRDTSRAGDPATYRAIGLGVDLRLSLFGVLSTDHRFERYFDVGVNAGAGGGVALGVPPHDVAGTFSGWVGGWTEIGTINAGSGYLALIGSIRREAFDDMFLDQTQLLVGVAWRKRTVVPPGPFRD